MLRLMVQGDRDAQGIEGAVRQLGQLCKEREIGLNVGEAGKIVRILGETGAHVRVHQAKKEPPNVPEGFTGEIYPLESAARNLIMKRRLKGATVGRMAWAIRLAHMSDTSDGFLFFPGREGTLAHLVPILAFIAKGERDKGVPRPRRVALVDWPDAKKDALLELFNIGDDDEWVGSFDIEEMRRVVSWLTDGLPVK